MNTGKRFILAALSGGLFILCFPFPGQGWLAFLALVPLLVVVYETGPGVSFLAGWLAGTVFFAGLGYWVGFYGALPLSLMAGVIGLFFGVAAAIISYASVTLKRLLPSRRLWIVRAPVVAMVWTGLEVIRSETGVYSFPYGTTGLSQHAFPPLVALAAVFGVYGVSTLVILVNALLAEAWTASREGAKKQVLGLVAAVVVLLAIGLSAGIWLRDDAAAAPGATYKIAVVQASIPQNEKWLVAKQDEIMARYQRLVLQASRARPDLIVLPEAALPAYVTAADPLYAELADWARQTRTPILAGVPLLTRTGPYNTTVLFNPDGQPAGLYAKMVPALFGELVPFRSLAGLIYPRLKEIGDISRGSRQTIFTLHPATAGRPPLRFGVLICSESLYSRLARALGVSRAEALFVLTNDAWFYQSNEAALHFGASQFRAAETGRYLTQAANTGESGLINAAGEPEERTEVDAIGVTTGYVRAQAAPTFYSRFGYLLPIALAVLSVLMTPCLALVNNCTRRK